MVKTPKKICIYCSHHKYHDQTKALVCNSPELGKHAGQIAVTMLREMGNQFQTDSVNECLDEICGREGKWYHVK
jgi:hypothetical protein